MDELEIKNKVYQCLEKSCGLKKDDIKEGATLVDDLGIDSIDLVDLIYELETGFGFSIKIDELERHAKENTNGEFESEGLLTKEGAQTLKMLVPEVNPDKIKEGMPVYNIPKLYTVEALCSMVRKKLMRQA